MLSVNARKIVGLGSKACTSQLGNIRLYCVIDCPSFAPDAKDHRRPDLADQVLGDLIGVGREQIRAKSVDPLYVKIDVEHFDQFVLAELFSAGIAPPFISAEAHTVEVFALLVANGYTSFALVDGATVGMRYAKATIRTLDGPEQFAFKPHSAGPFGEDISGLWEDANSFFQRLAWEGLGWKDIHASKIMPVAAPRSGLAIARWQASALARKLLGYSRLA